MAQSKSEKPSRQPPGGGRVNAARTGLAESSHQREFIDNYLRTRLYDLTDENREIVAKGIAQFEGGNTTRHEQLIHFLDELYRQHVI